jgi:hypothetical protein
LSSPVSSADEKVSLRRFITFCELLDHAYPEPVPAPDYLMHECELAEQALFALRARSACTSDPRLAKLLAVTWRQPR